MKGYLKTHKLSLIVLVAALCLILLSSFCASMIQSDAFRVKVTDLQNAKNEGVLVDSTTKVNGVVASGILFMPKAASEKDKRPAVVLTHGYLNNRELQLQNAIELARRGFIVLTIDRGGHGNNEVTTNTNALINTTGLYESAKYLYNLPQVDKTRIGISGHSMGGMATITVLGADIAPNTGLGIISAGLVQGYNVTRNGTAAVKAGPNVSVGVLKAKDDEFFFSDIYPTGEKTICREFLQSKGAAAFVNFTEYNATVKDSINIENGGIYVNGIIETPALGQKASAPFRVVYEADEIHPQNHFSTESASYITNFFYTAFGTPTGNPIKETRQTWWVKEMFSTLGLIGFFALLLPIATLLLTVPFFKTLKKKKAEVVTETGGTSGSNSIASGNALLGSDPELKGVRKHVSYWIVGVLTTLFSGFSIKWMWDSKTWLSKFGDLFTQNTYLPQDVTGRVAAWAIVCGLFALICTGVVWCINHIINRVKNKDDFAKNDTHPMAAAKIDGGVAAVGKTALLAGAVVVIMYAVLFLTWAIFKVDFRIWTLNVKTFEISKMLPTILRYTGIFFIFYFINSILNQNYRVKNLPEWATTAINAAFSVLGILLIFIIQYGTFRTTGVLWDSDPLKYIVLFPIVPILILATVYSRQLFKKTGNAWLGAAVNALLFTIMIVTNTAASYPLAGLFA